MASVSLSHVLKRYALYPHMSVRANMGFSLMLANKPKSEIDHRVNQAADILSLTPYLDRLPKQLSGGQRQRVAMGRAIVRKAQVFLFDEPVSNLDAKLRGQMRTEIKALHQRLKVTSIYVTHDQIEAMAMADKVVVLKDGRVRGLKAVVEVVEPTGADTMVVAHVGAGSDKHEVQIVQRDRVTCQPNDIIWLTPDASRIHLFDSASGQRIN